MSRRTFLAAGVGVSLAGLGLTACGDSSDATPAHQSPHDGTATAVPRTPPDRTRYVSRPDLTPPGVTITATASFRASSLAHSYVFCAPKSPLAANPGPTPPGVVGFPEGATPGLMILDTHGELVWFKPLPGGDSIPFNFQVQTYRGKPTLTWFQGNVHGGHATGGHYVLADDTYQQIAEVHETTYPCDLHEFILTPEGTALHTAYQPGVVTDAGAHVIVGHAQEVDVATNALVFDWPCYPAVSPDLSSVPATDDYFHINSIALWPGPERNLLISSRNTSAVYLVDRQTGQVAWRLGGKQSDFAMGPAASFCFQHDARPLADGSGVSLFDDASQPCPEKVASGKVLLLDQTTKRATLRHRYLHTDGELDVHSQGNCQLLANGGHMVGWGYLPYFSAYAPSEDTVAPMVLDGRIPEGASSYRTFLFDWTGRPPLSELALVVLPSAGTGHFTAWVSWNGATEVATWTLRAGPTANALVAVATVAKHGFETAIPFTHAGAKVFEAIAHDASGQVLGASGPVDAD